MASLPAARAAVRLYTQEWAIAFGSSEDVVSADVAAEGVGRERDPADAGIEAEWRNGCIFSGGFYGWHGDFLRVETDARYAFKFRVI